jgi:murein L,D-transpeptidase YcbB/YkuD
MHYEHDVLRPIEPTTDTVVLSAAAAPSLEEYVGQMRWMHPLYAQIRQALMAPQSVTALQSAAITSLQRIRDIPAPRAPRHVLIDIPSATLWMYEGDHVVDSMRVVVGKADTPTPQMAGWIRYATLKPYWNVPPHLIRGTIAPNVRRQGVAYLRTRGYEVLSDWSDAPTVLDPTTIDWKAVAEGTLEVRVRQKPNAINSMGKVKYEFPNPQGIYLHDTPEKEKLRLPVRQLSNGCIRLEDAERFGRWLFEGTMPTSSGTPEERVNVALPVPIYVTYLTVKPEGGQLALGTDPYGLDGTAPSGLARLH